MITPGIVTFDPAAFQQAFPAFAQVPGPVLEGNFGLATLQLNNSYCSIVKDVPTRAGLLNLLTAHITALLNGVNGQPPTGVVGRISSAQQGSVSIQTEFKTESEAAAFYQQSIWGSIAWQSMAVYRTARYVNPRCDAFGDSWGGAWPE